MQHYCYCDIHKKKKRGTASVDVTTRLTYVRETKSNCNLYPIGCLAYPPCCIDHAYSYTYILNNHAQCIFLLATSLTVCPTRLWTYWACVTSI